MIEFVLSTARTHNSTVTSQEFRRAAIIAADVPLLLYLCVLLQNNDVLENSL